jgi:disulfide bond formation protein DsbB
MNSLYRNRRVLDLLAAVCCFALVGFALYSQQFMGLTPCPLCIFQRVGLAGLGLAFLLSALPTDRQLLARRVGAVLVAAVAAVTAGIAARHLYIQHLPPGLVPVCGATLDYMLDVFPLTDVLRKVLTGSGECAKVDWTFLGLAMPAWVLLWSAGLGVAGFLLNWRRSGR